MVQIMRVFVFGGQAIAAAIVVGSNRAPGPALVSNRAGPDFFCGFNRRVASLRLNARAFDDAGPAGRFLFEEFFVSGKRQSVVIDD